MSLMQPVSFLIADDIELTRLSVRRLLAYRPHWKIVAEASDGRQAVQLASLHRPNVALVDVMMPGLDGIRATEQIKAMSPETRVIVYSAYRDEAFQQHALMAGADAFLRQEDLDGPAVEALLSGWFPNPEEVHT